MNTHNSDDELDLIRKAYQEIRYPGRLADDVIGDATNRIEDRDDSLDDSHRRRVNKRVLQLGWFSIAVAAVFAFILLRMTAQPDNDENRSIAESTTVERNTDNDINVPSNSPTDSSASNPSDLVDNSSNGMSAPSAPSSRQPNNKDPFRVFVSRRQVRVSTWQPKRIASTSRVRSRRSGDTQSEPSFSLFPSSTSKSSRNSKLKTDASGERSQSFRLFPPQSRSTNT